MPAYDAYCLRGHFEMLGYELHNAFVGEVLERFFFDRNFKVVFGSLLQRLSLCACKYPHFDVHAPSIA